MDIHLVSSLTAEDEETAAPRILDALCGLLDQMPIAYTVRVETGSGRVLQHRCVSDSRPPKMPA